MRLAAAYRTPLYTPVRWRTTSAAASRRAGPRRAPKALVPVELTAQSKPTGPSKAHALLRDELQALAATPDLARRLAGYGVPREALAAVCEALRVPSAGARPQDVWLPLLRHYVRKTRASTDINAFGPAHMLAAAYDAQGIAVLHQAALQAFLTWLDAELAALAASAVVHEARTQLALLRTAADLRVPALSYTAARTLTRQIHLHVGPTNSGKTHGALVALSRARTGLYAGPLRLLAHEVWERLNEGSIAPHIPPRACNLRTGEEQRVVDPQAGLVSCTVEMADPTSTYDVAVIDEIQMIADPQRGSAWTQAVLGLPAKELHLCGEARAVPLLERIAALCGDELHVHEYHRLTPLAVASESLRSDLSRIQPGDCLVAFSRSAIFQLKQQVEARTGLQCAVAYGALPPETKSEQAKLFNAGKLDVMVASDAIGMGLNLRIKRIVFDTLSKWNGTERVPLSLSQIKQIAGRAGRYGTSHSGVGGEVLTRHEHEMETLRLSIAAPIRPITHAVVQPTSEQLASFSLILPRADRERRARFHGRPLSMLYEDYATLAQVDSVSFALSDFESQHAMSPILEHRSRDRLTHAEKEKWAHAPVNVRDERAVAWVGNAVERYARGELVHFDDCAEGLGTLEAEEAVAEAMDAACERRNEANSEDSAAAFVEDDDEDVLNISTLMLLESHHRSLSLYLWLAYRFPLAFCFRREVDERKTRTEHAIEFCLEAIRVRRAQRLARLGRSDEAQAALRKARSKRQK